MTYQDPIERQDSTTREDLLLGASELTARISACRRVLRTARQPLAASEVSDIYAVLGDCALELSAQLYQRRQDEARLMGVVRLLGQLSFAPAPEPAAVVAMAPAAEAFAEAVAAD